MSLKEEFFKKRDLYLEKSQEDKHLDNYGWNKSDKCDGLLYNSLWSVAGANVDIELARLFGKWHRHPSFSCYLKNESKSEISRDMYIGLMIWIIFNRRVDILHDLIEFGEENNWIMGKGDITRTYISPSLRGTIYFAAWVLYKKESLSRFLPNDWFFLIPFKFTINQKGYIRHLQALHIFILSMLRSPTNREVKIMKYHAENQNRNALMRAIYNFVAGNDQNDAIELLMDEDLFPNDRLPTTRNYQTSYLFCRDQDSSSWLPEIFEDEKEHSGIDWLFTSKIIEISEIWNRKKICITD